MSRFETAEYDPSDFESREAADKNVYIKFYMFPVEDAEASAREGRPIFKEVEYIEIRTPGQQNSVIRRPVRDMERQRWRQQYKMFKEGMEEQVIGTPLSEVTWISRSQVEELAYIKIRTLEHLAAVGDDVCNKMAGLYTLKQKAQKAVELAASQAPMTAMQAQLDEMKNLIETQSQTIKDQSDIIKKLQANQK